MTIRTGAWAFILASAATAMSCATRTHANRSAPPLTVHASPHCRNVDAPARLRGLRWFEEGGRCRAAIDTDDGGMAKDLMAASADPANVIRSGKWLYSGDAVSKSLMRAAADGGITSAVAHFDGVPTCMAVDELSAFVRVERTSETTHPHSNDTRLEDTESLVRVPLHGGPVVTLASSNERQLNASCRVTLAPPYVYWSDGIGSIFRIRRDGGGVEKLVADGLPALASVTSMKVEGDVLLWTADVEHIDREGERSESQAWVLAPLNVESGASASPER